jgi:hypothetical protein
MSPLEYVKFVSVLALLLLDVSCWLWFVYLPFPFLFFLFFLRQVLTIWHRLASDPCSSSPNLPTNGITSSHHDTQLEHNSSSPKNLGFLFLL